MNIIDVAKAAGVSKTTVSRVLTNSKLVKPETREKVLATIEKMGFIPNTSAQKLAGNRNYVIGIINSESINDPFYGYVEDQIAQACRKRGYGVIYTVTQNEKSGCEKEISMLYGKVDAFIILGNQGILKKDVEKVVRMQMPIALFKTDIEKEGAMSVDVDNEHGGYMAARYLLGKGYQKIGYMHGSRTRDFREGNQREAGFVKAMKEAGTEIAAHFYGTRGYSVAYYSTEEVISSGIDALFCETDMMAYGILQGMKEKEISIPDTIAVLGFDNAKFTNYETQIKLSTIGQPLEKMAAYMVEGLIDMLEYGQKYQRLTLFETDLIEGETT
ncbi:MAG TPA: LacI family transcriptional regulator [Candidatus Eisenbergiella intestinipullorum]|nr:LacI family transcriptional regulator [Candidatus Eisenbergiella intestinipullorum]